MALALRRLVEAELVKEDGSGKRLWIATAGQAWLRRPLFALAGAAPLRWISPCRFWDQRRRL